MTLTATPTLTDAELLKFDLLAEGLGFSTEARRYIDERNHDRSITSADYASTSGVILVLDDDVWVNSPITEHNPNFVTAPRFRLDVDSAGLFVHGAGRAARARFWIPPAWHDEFNSAGEPFTGYGYTHTDRVRVSPIEGCAFTCRFCDLPYEFRYRSKRVDAIVETVAAALNDPIQPASHVLISGGTPRPEDHRYVQSVYEAVISSFPDIGVDIMMVPTGNLMDPQWLAELGVNEVSVNLELWSESRARTLMPRKHKQGREHYLDYLTNAASVLGGARVRSMLMLGLEPVEETLRGVEEIAARGATPVLSPFRPDPSTPLRDWPVPTAAMMVDAYLAAREIVARHGVSLGPSCIPCAHNTMTLPTSHGHGYADRAYGTPNVV